MTFSPPNFFLFTIAGITAHKTHTLWVLKFLIQSQMLFNGKRGQEKYAGVEGLFNPEEAREPEKLSRCPQN